MNKKNNNLTSLELDVLKAIKYITVNSSKGIKPRPNTINSFLKGANKSPFYEEVFFRYKDICAKYPGVTLNDIKRTLKSLKSENLIKKDSEDYVIVLDDHNSLDKIENKSYKQKLKSSNVKKSIKHSKEVKALSTKKQTKECSLCGYSRKLDVDQIPFRKDNDNNLLFCKKCNTKRYKYYYKIKDWIRNAFSDIEMDYTDKYISFYSPSMKLKFKIFNNNNKTFFQIKENDLSIYEFRIPENNLKEIKKAIESTYPKDITLQSVRINMKLHNRFSSSRFKESNLLSLAKWSQNKTSHKYLVDKNYTYYGHSKPEIKIVKYLMKNNCAKLLRGQDFSIKYKNKNDKIRKFYPDIVYLNHLNQIVILEVKAKGGFATENNILKYIGLAEYCRKEGYVYGMIDKDFNTYLSYRNGTVLKKFEKDVLKIVKDKGYFNSQSLTELRNKKYLKYKRKDLDKMLIKIILDHQLVERPKTVHDLNILNKKIKCSNFNTIFSMQ